jgi:signal transduction histidine kinase
VSNNRIRPDEIRLSVKLKGSSYWINSIYPVKPLPVKLSFSDFIESASIFVFFLTIAIALIVYSLVRPLKGLSKATVKVGQREDNALLPVEGPNEIRQVTQSFNQMSRRVNELLREKDAMLGALGHDLRTPLTSLRLRVDKMTPVETREDVINTLDETAKLIDDILEFARSVGDRGTMSDYDITSILYDVVADYQDMQTDVTLIDAPRIVAPCKPAAIKRMMRDLIENALKYAGSAQVSISTYDNCVTIKVEDEGPGVEEAMFDSLLQPFKRGEDSRSRSTGGTGLGLAIAKSVANAHGGDVMLMNRKPKGLCVIASILL